MIIKQNIVPRRRHNILSCKFTSKKFDELMNISFRVHNLLGCKGVTRSDFKYYKNKFYLLETNTQPGMTNYH